MLVYHGIVLANPFTGTLNYPVKAPHKRLKLVEFGGRPLFVWYANFHTGKGGDWMGKEDLRCGTDEELRAGVAAIRRAYVEYEQQDLRDEVVGEREVGHGARHLGLVVLPAEGAPRPVDRVVPDDAPCGNHVDDGPRARRPVREREAGDAWGFLTPTASVYRFRGTRASTVPAEIFGKGAHIGVLGVDRYSAYNCAWRGRMQYCLEHFKRNVRDLLEAEPKDKEYQRHIPRFLELLASAMTLRNRKRGKEYDEESVSIRDELLAIARSPVKDGRLKGYFDLIVNRRERFFQWVCNPEVEAENNLAERRLRPLVIARKVCFGSQSEKGLKTRETLMTVIDTLSLRCDDPVAKLSQVLDAIGRNKKTNVSELLWGPKTQPANAAKA